ncbi:hypothetical protein [Sinorhizobium fredii]|uniref:hypothetical protein n=1 Tax=Rhizobium fredii TaxID=380 RepID=UPI0005B428F6|nr:hypothetical protein [Sinorhizobium fredii]
MKHTLVAALILSLSTAVSAQERKRHVPRYHYFHCTAVHRILAEAHRHAGNKVSEAAQRVKADRLYQEGKRDLIEVGKDPSEAERRVQKFVDEMIGKLEADPKLIRVYVFGCSEDYKA